MRVSIRSFQSPSLRGSGRFFSSPGTISLHPGGFNPLHCGAVVASRRCRGSGADHPLRFNPLHCGAVVASDRPPRRTAGAGPVSIPFIAGQWSLHVDDMVAGLARALRFNPLHCGAVVASTTAADPPAECGDRFNPLHCGAVVAS